MPELTSQTALCPLTIQSEEKSNCPIRGQKVLFCVLRPSGACWSQHGGADSPGKQCKGSSETVVLQLECVAAVQQGTFLCLAWENHDCPRHPQKLQHSLLPRPDFVSTAPSSPPPDTCTGGDIGEIEETGQRGRE